MDILIVLATGTLCIVCFLIGAKVGQTVSKGEDIKTPNLNPLTAYTEHRVKKEAEMEQNRLDTILRNIEGYDGTSKGQEDVPGR